MNSYQATLISRLMVASAFGLIPQSSSAASTVQFQTRILTVEETAGQAELSVVRQDGLETEIFVDFLTLDATAIAGLDYTAVSGTVAFLQGETSHTIVIPILNDGLIEPLERFQVTLTNVTGDAVLGTTRVATISIRDNETPVQLEFATYWAREDEGAVQIGIVRGGEAGPLTLEVVTAEGTAKAGEDYQAVAAEVTFEAGENLKLLSVPILIDGIKEAEESFHVYITNAPAGVVSTTNKATITIWDNDPGIQFEQGKFWIQEDQGQLTVKVLRGSDVGKSAFSVDYATSDVTAVAGVDYAAVRGTLYFAADESFRVISVPVLVNQASKADTRFALTLSNLSSGFDLGVSTATVNVLDVTGLEPHGFAELTVSSEQGALLGLTGGVSERFTPFFDLYPLEVSADLVEWTPLMTLQRSNSAGDQLLLMDSGGAQDHQRYYRQPTAWFIAPNERPSGTYAVGRVNRWLTDASRRNRFMVSSNDSFQVTVWYPATPRAGCWPTHFLEEPIRREEWWWGDLMDRAPYFRSYSCEKLELAVDQETYPIVLLSHGYKGTRADLFEKGEVLASHGYIVVAPDHNDATAIVFPDGDYELLDKLIEGGEAGLRDRVRDFSFIADQMEAWFVNDPIFAGRLDLGKIAAMGVSVGGATALEFCRADTRCRAAVALDPMGFTTPELPKYGLQKPSLTINRSDNGDFSLYDKAAADAVRFQISNTSHGDIGGWAWWPGTLAAVQNAAEVNRSANAFTVWFLNKHLRGSTEAMPVLTDYPRIINFEQK